MVNCHFALGAIIMLILFGILFYLSTILESKYDIHGIWKGCVLAIPLLVLSLSSYMAGKKLEITKCDEEVYLHWFLMAAASVIIPLFKRNLFTTSLSRYYGVGIGMALPCLDALITQGIEKEQRDGYVIL